MQRTALACATVLVSPDRRLCHQKRDTIWIGVTDDLGRRMPEHKSGNGSRFISCYGSGPQARWPVASRQRWSPAGGWRQRTSQSAATEKAPRGGSAGPCRNAVRTA
ncbi:hypothetical protein MES4922_360180 [Mesorhizobium ventifaucium]|uniref:GIY-YIG domain-containing protein n=1 Tax=Mesorhizobium ventifaucium TaxID=666020 RepID=A0ABN8K2R1_9HYPH|nr:hypothetical protein MES4922_360180 [Mesorhizobium ventifaucium]